MLGESVTPAPPEQPWLDATRNIDLGTPDVWYAFVETDVNGRPDAHPWNVGVKDSLQVRMRLSVGCMHVMYVSCMCHVRMHVCYTYNET